MEKVLETYLIDNPEIKSQEGLYFVYNAKIINQKDKTNVEVFFSYNPRPIVLVEYNMLVGG